MTDRLIAAWQRRSALHELGCYRILHGWQEDMPGVHIDRYGNAAIIGYKPAAAPDLPMLAATLTTLHPFELVVAKPRDGAPFALHGTLPAKPYHARERDLTFAIEPAQARNPGLHLDARPARDWLRNHSRDRRVLNLFAFTGSLGVSCAVAGARGVTHVDSQRGALMRCQRNHALNNVAIDDRDLVRGDIYRYLRRAVYKQRHFDGIIVDAPPYRPTASTNTDQSIATLAKLTAQLLNPGAWLLCFFHHSEHDHAEHEREFRNAAALELDILWQGTSGADFPESNPHNKLRLTAFQRTG